SYAVAQRSREIGVRIALGASISQVRRMVVAQGLTMAVTGLAIGLAAAFAVRHVLASLLFGITPADPVTFLMGAVVRAVVALVACWVPARRAARVDPLLAMRAD